MKPAPVLRIICAYKHLVPLRMPFLLFLFIFSHVCTYLFHVSRNTAVTFHHSAEHCSRSIQRIYQYIKLELLVDHEQN